MNDGRMTGFVNQICREARIRETATAVEVAELWFKVAKLVDELQHDPTRDVVTEALDTLAKFREITELSVVLHGQLDDIEEWLRAQCR